MAAAGGGAIAAPACRGAGAKRCEATLYAPPNVTLPPLKLRAPLRASPIADFRTCQKVSKKYY